LDKFATENTNFDNAISGCPVCCPYRASLMTGVYPHKNGMVTNDLCLAEMYDGPYLAERLNEGGYQTAYLGKWHIDGKGISDENLIKIFQHGFTTKETGHGFGLHSCGNYMNEMKGKITVASDGIGKGSTFSLLFKK
jgi:arylsulfatase A-like enzyme